jgi:hypothetical protein
MNEEFARFEGLIQEAAAAVGNLYFQLPVAERTDAVYRERVYCYELYHQLRLIWKGFDFTLCGEVDKGGHPLFCRGDYQHAKPDFLVHRPGEMERNLACVEVKPCVRPWDEFRDDLKKLTWFCHHARYHRGMFLVYGAEKDETESRDLLKTKLRRAMDDPAIDRECICLMHHAAVGKQTERVML